MSVSLEPIVSPRAKILITGARGFVGSRTVEALLRRGFRNLRCLVRDESDLKNLSPILEQHHALQEVEIVTGNLLSREDCHRAALGVDLVYHLAAGTGQKSFADAYMNSVVTTRNLLDACVAEGRLKRFVSISTFAVYTNRNNPGGRLLDETAPIETTPVLRGEAYCYAKLRQDDLVQEYGEKHGIPFVLLRPGVVYGPGKGGVSGRVGRELGIFLHFGGSNPLPLTYVENCAEAIALAGLTPGVDGEVFNIVDDDLPSSRAFLRLYKRHVKRFRSVYIPKPLSFLLCLVWEKYSAWSRGQLPPILNTRAWHAYWKGARYSNQKLKTKLHWSQTVPTPEALNRFFNSCRQRENHA